MSFNKIDLKIYDVNYREAYREANFTTKRDDKLNELGILWV